MIEIQLANGRNAQFANGEVAARWFDREMEEQAKETEKANNAK